VIVLAAPDIVVTPTNPLLTIPDLNSEIKKLPPVEKPEGAAKQSSESEQDSTSEAEKAVKKDSQNSKNNRLLQKLGGPNSELSIAVEKGSKKMIIKIVNSETKEVIRQIPPDELVRLAESLNEPNGALLDQTV
jgi:flagellar protein FlaG